MAEVPEVYRWLPTAMRTTCTEELGMERLGTNPDDYISSFLKTHISHKEAERVNQLKVQMVWLEAPPQRKTTTDLGKRPRKRLTSRQKKELKLYQIPKEHQKKLFNEASRLVRCPEAKRYSMYLTLHELWKRYMNDLLPIGKKKGNVGQAQMNKSVAKADLHGCLITVQKSKCPSYIGTEGIVLQETQNTFKLICKDDKLKTVPKANSIFTFDFYGHRFSLYGNHLRFRSGERSARKFKDKPTLDL